METLTLTHMEEHEAQTQGTCAICGLDSNLTYNETVDTYICNSCKNEI